MTKLLDEAVRSVRVLPARRQNEIARILLRYIEAGAAGAACSHACLFASNAEFEQVMADFNELPVSSPPPRKSRSRKRSRA